MKKRRPHFLLFILILFLAVNIPLSVFAHNNTFQITEFTIRSDQISEPLTIVQISDLHEKSFGEQNSDLLKSVREQKPDLIAITGDIIYNSYTKTPDIAYMETLAAGCSDIAPSFFVTGNHDRHNEQAVKEAFSENGVTVLNETTVPFASGTNRITIGGIDDASLDKDSIDRFSFQGDSRFHLMLAHTPDAFRTKYDKKDADLILSGHTHGGQIRLPWGKALFTPEGAFPEISDGLYTSGDTTMIVSMGLGSSVVPFRLFAWPEITVIYLLPKTA